jgi:guanylate kinase
VLSGPSGVGKSTLLNALRTLAPELWISISVTTRHPRPGERHGVEYYFVDSDTFATMVRDGDLLEWAEFADNHYGTPREPVLDRLAAGSPVLLELEIQGARQIRTSLPEALLVFLTPPSWEELVRRLTGRGTEAQEVIDSRLRVAREELAAEPEFDVTLVNTSVEEVVGKLLALTNG